MKGPIETEYGYGWVPTKSYYNDKYRCHIYASDDSTVWLEASKVEDSEFPGIRCQFANEEEAEIVAKQILTLDKYLTDYNITWVTDGGGVNHRIPDF